MQVKTKIGTSGPFLLVTVICSQSEPISGNFWPWYGQQGTASSPCAAGMGCRQHWHAPASRSRAGWQDSCWREGGTHSSDCHYLAVIDYSWRDRQLGWKTQGFHPSYVKAPCNMKSTSTYRASDKIYFLENLILTMLFSHVNQWLYL